MFDNVSSIGVEELFLAYANICNDDVWVFCGNLSEELVDLRQFCVEFTPYMNKLYPYHCKGKTRVVFIRSGIEKSVHGSVD